LLALALPCTGVWFVVDDDADDFGDAQYASVLSSEAANGETTNQKSLGLCCKTSPQPAVCRTGAATSRQVSGHSNGVYPLNDSRHPAFERVVTTTL